jgi:hypothetical protein
MTIVTGKPPRPPTQRAARHTKRAYFDFNVVSHAPSVAEAAAHNASSAGGAALIALFEGLEQADDALASDPRNPRAAVAAALTALIQFGLTNSHGKERRFSRVAELLLEDLSSLPAPPIGEIFPAMKGWKGRKRFRRAQACAAYALELLRSGDDDHGVPSRQEAATDVTAVLLAHHVVFALDREDPVDAVIAWGKRSTAQAANDDLAKLRSNPPTIEADVDRVQQRLAVLKWLGDELEKAGYDCA